MGLGGLREGLGRERDRSEIEPVAGTQRAAHVLIRSHCFALSGERWRAGDAAGSIAGSEAGSAAGSAAGSDAGSVASSGASGGASSAVGSERRAQGVCGSGSRCRHGRDSASVALEGGESLGGP
jgi:hypothetical protein